MHGGMHGECGTTLCNRSTDLKKHIPYFFGLRRHLGSSPTPRVALAEGLQKSVEQISRRNGSENPPNNSKNRCQPVVLLLENDNPCPDGKIEDSGPLNKKRMETVDEEFLAASLKFIDKAHKADKPLFVWFNSTRMHYHTHLKPASEGGSGQGFYNDGMVEHDGHVGVLLKKLDDLKIVDNTIVIYTTDNGPHFNQWPDAAITPYRGEKNTNWEGGYRVPAMVRWPGKIKPGVISNQVMSHLDWVPTLMAAVGDTSVKADLKKGKRIGGDTFKVHLDGYNFLPFLTGAQEQAPRREFFYFSDDGLLTSVRVGDWKFVFAEQRSHRFDVWRDPFVILRIPKIFNLRRDPYERADTDSNGYNIWWDHKIGAIGMLGMGAVGQFVGTLQEFPPRQRPGSFTIDQVMEAVYKK